MNFYSSPPGGADIDDECPGWYRSRTVMQRRSCYPGQKDHRMHHSSQQRCLSQLNHTGAVRSCIYPSVYVIHIPLQASRMSWLTPFPQPNAETFILSRAEGLSNPSFLSTTLYFPAKPLLTQLERNIIWSLFLHSYVGSSSITTSFVDQALKLVLNMGVPTGHPTFKMLVPISKMRVPR